MLFEQYFLSFIIWEIGDLSDNKQLLNKGKPLFFSFVHYVLLSTSSQYPLKEQNCNFSFYIVFCCCRFPLQLGFGYSRLAFNKIHVLIMPPVGGGRSSDDVSECLNIIAHNFILSSLRSMLLIDIVLGHFKSLLVCNGCPWLFLLLLYYFLIGYFNLSQPIVGVQSHWLNFIFIGKLVQSQAFSTNPCVYIWPIVRVVFNNIP